MGKKVALYKKIASDVVKFGRKEATDKWGVQGIKDAQDSLRRNAATVRKRSGRTEEIGVKSSKERNAADKAKRESLNEDDDYRTPTRNVAARPVPKNELSKKILSEKVRSGNRSRPENAETTILGSKETSRPDKKTREQILKGLKDKSKARKQADSVTGETRAEFEARIDREARGMGVQSGSGPAEKGKPLHSLTTDQANDALRGRTKGLDPSMDNTLEANDTEMDLVDILKQHGGYASQKKGGKVKAKARGVGAALRGYGKVIGGKK